MYKTIQKAESQNERNQQAQLSLLERLNVEFQKDRERIDTRLGKMDDSAKIYEFVYQRCSKVQNACDEGMEQKVAPIKAKLNRINQENLIVPNLIGPTCKYKNMRDWIQDRVKADERAARALDAAVAAALATKLEDATQIPLEKI